MKRIAMAAGLMLATLIGGGLALFGTGADRLVGLAVALMFGGGGLAWWVVNRRRDRPMPGFQIGAVASAGGHEVAFIARSDRRVLIAGAVGCLAFGGGMLLLVLAPGGALDLEGAEAVIVFAGGLLMIGVGVFGLLRMANNSHFALTRRGLHAVGPAGWFVPWDAIAGLGEIAVHGNPFLGVRVGDPAAIHMSRFQRLAHGLQRSTMGIDLSIPIRTLTVDPAELVTAVARYREHPEYRSLIGRADELAVIREAAVPEVRPASAIAPRQRRSIRRMLGIGALFLIGGLLVLLVVSAATDEVRPGQELSRLISVVLFGGLALGQLAAAVLLVRNVAIGRTIAIGSTLGLIALILYGLVRSGPDDRAIGLVLLAVVGAELLLVVIGARVAGARTETEGPAP